MSEATPEQLAEVLVAGGIEPEGPSAIVGKGDGIGVEIADNQEPCADLSGTVEETMIYGMGIDQ